MKLLIATDGFLPRWDGISSFLNELIPRIQDDYNITVVAPNLGDHVPQYKIRLIRYPVLKARLADNYYPCLVDPFSLAREIKSADVVWVQCLGPIGIISIILSRIYKKKVLLYNHMIEWEVYAKSQKSELLKVPINIITKFFGKLLYAFCDVIIVSSVEHAELLNIIGIKSQKKVAHLGVDINRYKPGASKAVAKDSLGIDPLKFVIGYAGRVSMEKDIKTLYRAFMRLYGKDKNIVLLIAGGGHPELENLLSSKKNVILTGLKDNLAPYYQAMDIYVLPSLTETTSLTTMEAMASGTAVVATPVGFVKEYINDGVNGLIYPKKNSYSLYLKLKYLKEHNEERERLGKNARETIKENYTWEKTAESIKKIINDASPLL